MTAPNRVDELRKRYHENPRRYFAPLANEYRKTGFVDRAILLCEKHLGEQPGNMNGLVVYGQCLFETGRHAEAQGPFEAALALDPENLIALRHLGDIARLTGDADAARKWYGRVLELDRRNDDVIALLGELGGAPEAAPEAPSRAPNIVSVAPSVSVSGADEERVGAAPPAPRPSNAPPAPVRRTPPRASTPTRAATPPRSRTPVDPSAKTVEVSATARPPKRVSLLDVEFDFGELPSAESPSAPPPAPAPAATPALPTFVPQAPTPPTFAPLVEAPPIGMPEAEIAPIDGLEKAEFSAEVSPLADLESHEFVGGEAAPLEGLEADDYSPLGTAPLDGLESTEFAPPPPPPPSAAAAPEEEDEGFHAASLDELSHPVDDLPLLAPLGQPEPEARRSSPVEGIPLLPALEEAETLEIDVDAVRANIATPPTFVTETMAQVYIQQGHTEKAIEVYRQLVAQSPADAGLRERLRALEVPAAPEPPVATPEPAWAAADEPEVPPAEEMVELDLPPIIAGTSVPEPEAPARPVFGFETPVSTDAVVAPEPADAMLAEMSFDGLSLTTPDAGVRTPTPTRPTPAVPGTPVSAPAAAVAPAAGPTAREFFAGFAKRSLTPAATAAVPPVVPVSPMVPSAAGGPLSPLDTLFGVDVNADDERAAHRLAAIGATSGPSGGSALDSLFGEGPSAPMPPELKHPTPTRTSVPRASDKLRFDQFFASSVPSATPSAPMAPVPAPEAMSEPASAPEPPSAVPPDDADEDDDLDQFQGWLRGLTQ